MAVIPGARKVTAGSAMGARKVARGLYDFATDGGAVSDITLRGDTIPSGALIVSAYIVVDTVPTSGGAATVAIKTEGAADINAADAISGAPWSSTGVKRADALVAANTGVKTTAARSIVATVATATLTAGKFSVLVEYYELAAQT